MPRGMSLCVFQGLVSGIQLVRKFKFLLPLIPTSTTFLHSELFKPDLEHSAYFSGLSKGVVITSHKGDYRVWLRTCTLESVKTLV